MPRVTVLLTCFNHLAYLPACVEGVRRQTYRDWRLVALDDGSTDGTRQWLNENLSDQEVVLNPVNLGTYGTLNVGLERAEGEFVAVLNDDDLWEPEKLERQVAMMDSNQKVGLVHTDGTFIDGAGKAMPGTPLGFEFPGTETGDVLLALVNANKIIASAAHVRKSCFDELGGFNANYFGSGDWEMWYRIAERFDVGFVAEHLTHYRVHGSNASHKLERIWKDDQMLREWISGRLPGYAGRFDEAELRAAAAHNWACLGTVRTLNGDPRGGRAAYQESLRAAPLRLKTWARYGATFLPRGAFVKLK